MSKVKRDPRVAARVAACFAISNMGQKVPERAADTPKNWTYNLEAHVQLLAMPYLESDYHERLYLKEARMWLKLIRANTDEELLTLHGRTCPWLAPILSAKFP